MFESFRKRIAFFIYPEVQWDLANLEVEAGVLRREKKDREVDPKNLMRELMGGVTLSLGQQENYLAPLSVEEVRELNRWGFELAHSQWWKYLVDWAINTQAAKTIGVLPHSREQAIFGSGRIDGILLLRDEVEARKNSHEQEKVGEGPFDENKVIPE